MKIAVVSAGTFTHVQSYIDFLKDCGHDVSFIALSPSPQRSVPIYDAWVGRESHYKKTIPKWRYLVAAFNARNIVKKLEPDIVHAHYATSAGLAAWFINHAKTIITVHGSDINVSSKNLSWKFLLKLFFRRAKVINVVSNELEKKVIDLGVPNFKVKNINLGINVDLFLTNRVKQTNNVGSLKLVCNRSFESIYDHITIIKALEELANRKVPFHMTFIGDGSLKKNLAEYVNDKGLSASFTFCGRVPHISQLKFFKDNDIYLSASLSDGTSLSLLEAMASSLLPVVSDITANRNILDENAYGILFEAGSYIDLADKLENVFLENVIPINYLMRNQEYVRAFGDRNKNLTFLYNEFLDKFD
jgi:L-malate glycosyltransferase